MHQSPDILASFGDWETRMERALASVRAGRGVLVVDDEDRENEGDLIHRLSEFLFQTVRGNGSIRRDHQLTGSLHPCFGYNTGCVPECSVYVKYHCFHNIRFLFFHLKSSENQKRFQVQYSIDSAWEEEKETLESIWYLCYNEQSF